jgi:O-antigen/teichoic acid export membrane protein
MKVRALAANIAAVVSGRLVAALAGLATVMVLTRHLGPQEFGYYRTALTYAGFASVLADLGIYLVTLREMSRPGADASRVVGAALPLRLLSSLTLLLLASAVAWTLPYDRVVKWGILIAAAVYTCLQASEFLVAVFQSVLQQGRNAIAEASGALATLAAVWLLAAVGAAALPMLGATLLGSALALTISWQLARRLVPFRISLDVQMWRRLIVLGLPIAGSQILGMAILRGDTLVLSLFQPAAAVGLYAVSAKMFELATSLPYMFAGLMMPTLTATAVRGEDFPRVLGHAVNTSAIYGVGAILMLAPFAPQVLTLIAGREFAVGSPALLIIAFAIPLAALSHVLRFALVACERPRLVLQADAAACALGFAGYLLLIPRYSILGAAIGTLVAEACSLIGMLRGLRRAGQPLPSPATAVKALGAGLCAAAVMLVLNRLEMHWIAALVLGGLVYLIALMVTRAIPRELLANLLRRRHSYQRST